MKVQEWAIGLLVVVTALGVIGFSAAAFNTAKTAEEVALQNRQAAAYSNFARAVYPDKVMVISTNNDDHFLGLLAYVPVSPWALFSVDENGFVHVTPSTAGYEYVWSMPKTPFKVWFLGSGGGILGSYTVGSNPEANLILVYQEDHPPMFRAETYVLLDRTDGGQFGDVIIDEIQVPEESVWSIQSLEDW